MKYFRVWFLLLTVLFSFIAYGIVTDPQVKSYELKVGIVIAAISFWGVVASWKRIW